jgi:2-dehydropantoate 2-reductase
VSAPRRYVVIGAGGVGAALAAGFHEAGIPVVLVSRGSTYAAIRERGLCFTQNGETRTLPIDVAGSPDEVTIQPGDVLVLTTKSQDAPATLADWAWRPAKAGPIADGSVAGPGVAAELPVLLTQNGLDAERAALRYFSVVVGGVTLVAARHVVAGEVEIGNAPRIGQLIIGAYPSAELAPQAAPIAAGIAADLRAANWLAQDVDRIGDWLAWKVLINTTFALAVLDGTAQEKASLREQLVAETRWVLAIAGYEFADLATLTYDASQAAIAAPAYGAHQNSIWQSFARGSGSEVDYLNGEVALLARRHGVAAPLNTALQRVLGRSAALGEGPGIHPISEVFAAASAVTPEGALR